MREFVESSDAWTSIMDFLENLVHFLVVVVLECKCGDILGVVVGGGLFCLNKGCCCGCYAAAYVGQKQQENWREEGHDHH